MDPERLADLRRRIACGRVPERWYADLLADRDYHAQRAGDLAHALIATNHERLAAQGEVARLRARVRVEAEDVERVGVTRAKVRAWLLVHDLLSEPHTVQGERWAGYGYLHHSDRTKDIANAIANRARQLGRPGLDILDEMAAMEVDP
jgi:hypothetical protein